MATKSSVSALQEYCAKNRTVPPIYDYLDESRGLPYLCQVDVLGMTSIGQGRSKRDAKHAAAATVVELLRQSGHPEIGETPDMTLQEVMPSFDMIVALRDYCVMHHHPLPTFDFVQQSGTPDAPEFIALCQVGSIKRYGASEKKKDARQKAAFNMWRIISDGEHPQDAMQVASLQSKIEEDENDRYKKFKTYRELTDSKTGELPGVLLCNRHKFFTKFYDHLKQNAKEVLNTEYDTYQQQAMDVFSALKLYPKIEKMPSADSMEEMVLIDLNCEYDVVFAGYDDKVYKDVVEYFREMLY